MAHTRTSPQTHGFTILEMSIVVLIIALLMGGIIGGKQIIRLAELRSVISDKEKYISAMNSFQQKYGYLPGDFPNATRYWAIKPTCPAIGPTGSDKVSETCNGDGDKSFLDAVNGHRESFLLWQHMSLADMIDGSYYGVTGALSNQNTIPGWNVPASRIEGAGFSMVQMDNSIATGLGYYPSNYGITLLFGKPYSPTYTFQSILPVDDARSIDAKSDDGMPATGMIRSPSPSYAYRISAPSTEPACTENAPILNNSTYDLDARGYCALAFITGFN